MQLVVGAEDDEVDGGWLDDRCHAGDDGAGKVHVGDGDVLVLL